MQRLFSILLLLLAFSCQTYQPIEIFPSLSAPSTKQWGKRGVAALPMPAESAATGKTQVSMDRVSAAQAGGTPGPVTLNLVPSEDGTYRTAVDVPLPARDGARLMTDLYFPPEDGSYPLVLERTIPDRRGPVYADGRGPLFARAGFVYAVQNVRGQFDSEGFFNPFQNEGEDGKAALQWIGAQPWFNGRLGIMGRGYSAYAACLAAAGSPQVGAMVLENCPSDLFLNGGFYLDGVPMVQSLLTEIQWHHLQYPGLLEGLRWDDALFHLPLDEMDDVLGYPLPFWDECLLHPSYDYYWKSLSLLDRHASIDAAVLHLGGWYCHDDLGGAAANFEALQARDRSLGRPGRQALWIGPWSEGMNSGRYAGFFDFGEACIIDSERLLTAWFSKWLRDDPAGDDLFRFPVRLFLLGADTWVDLPAWPPEEIEYLPRFLHSKGEAGRSWADGSLTPDPPLDFEEIDSFITDPLDPVLSELEYGTEDQRPVEKRADVLTFTSSPLENPLDVIGSPQAVIYANITTPDTDLFVMLDDVDEYGFSRPLSFGVMRVRFRDSFENPTPVSPEEINEYVIDMTPTANRFQKGHSIRLSIMGSYFPFITRNLNTGAAIGQDSHIEKAVIFCLHDYDNPSRLVLPCRPTGAPPGEKAE